MGMVGRIAQRWSGLNRSYVMSSDRASDVAGGLGAMSMVLRMLLQSAILAVGAWLVIHGQSTPGIIIAGSILGARAARLAAVVAVARLPAAANRADAVAAAGEVARRAERGG